MAILRGRSEGLSLISYLRKNVGLKLVIMTCNIVKAVEKNPNAINYKKVIMFYSGKTFRKILF